MFLGGDQYKNHISNSLIIKCHICGDTDLRLLGSNRTGDKDNPYVCGNGHTTWGAVNDDSIAGGTDLLFNTVNDCCCEGLECEFPESISVNFSGLIGVQARESKNDSDWSSADPDRTPGQMIANDIRTRAGMPWALCENLPVYEQTPCNGAWTYAKRSADGFCINMAGNCFCSEDKNQIFNYTGDSCEVIEYTQGCPEQDNDSFCRLYGASITLSTVPPGFVALLKGNNDFACTQSEVASKQWVQTFSINNPLSNCSPPPPPPPPVPPPPFPPPPIPPPPGGGGAGGNPLCCGSLLLTYGNDFFTNETAPQTVNGGPTFLQRIQANLAIPQGCSLDTQTVAWQYRNAGGISAISDACGGTTVAGNAAAPSLVFLTIDKYAIVRDPCSCDGSSCACKVYFTRENKIMYRIHPTTNPLTAPSNPENWTIADASVLTGGQNKPLQVFMRCSDGTIKPVDGEYEDSGAPDCPLVFPTSNNFCLGCSCNDCVDTPTMINCSDDQKAKTIWPYRIPAYPSAGFGDTYWQLFRDDDTYSNYATAYECEICPCSDPDDYPKCCKTKVYPSCFSLGTTKCQDEDSRYRIACSPPSDNFNVNMIDSSIRNLYKYRHSGGGPGLSIKPIFHSEISNVSLWIYPNHPDVQKCGVAKAGFVKDYNDPVAGTLPCPSIGGEQVPCFSSPSQNAWDVPQNGNLAKWGATGVKSIRGEDLYRDNEFIQQPHCLRRVKNPDLHDQNVLYAVNTADVSNQTLILDRFYKTTEDNSYDTLWGNIAQNNASEQSMINNKGDAGLTDAINNRFFPYPFIANSGSKVEPELVAVIISESGVGGQVAFATIPTSYDSDIFIDPVYDGHVATGKVPDFTNIGSCRFKQRITVHGYSVMYPFIDDPIWKEGYSVGNDGYYNYPVILPGQGYKVGDKIEFRCWKTLLDADDRGVEPNINESIWKEECLETIIATATITNVNQLGGILWYEFDEKDDSDNYLLFVGNCPCDYDKCKEPSLINPITGEPKCTTEIQLDECIGCVSRNCYPSGHKKIDALPDGFPGFPAIACTFQAGATIPVDEECSYFVAGGCFAGGGFYNYDFTDPDGNSMEGNVRAYCNQNCSSTFVPGANNSIQPIVLNANSCDSLNCYCVGDEFIQNHPIGNASPKVYITLQGDQAEEWLASKEEGDIVNGNCECDKQPLMNDTDPFRQNYIGPHIRVVQATAGTIFNGDLKCFPLNRSWEFYESNYARCACSGEPVTPELRPQLIQDYIRPPKRAQWKAEWLPNVNCFIQNIPEYFSFDVLQQLNPNQMELDENAEIDRFLSRHEACNPLKMDRFGKSYRFPKANITSNNPCRKFDTFNPLPNGVSTPDNYCRAYGFYQQKQPSCEVSYRGQYIMRAAEKGYNFYNNHLNTDCEPIIENIEIKLTKKEAKFDVSVGAPYYQDYLIPENLPTPTVGSDGKLECTADAWNSPSLSGTNNSRFFDSGFFEPNRYSKILAEITSDSANASDILPVLKITQSRPVEQPAWGPYPDTDKLTFTMPDIDGKDFDITDIYRSGVWDIPDPRSNCRTSVPELNCGQPCNNPAYNPPIGLPASGTRHSFINDCQYPWEATDSNDHYCMFKNNSAEIVLDEIEECTYCLGTTMLTKNTSFAFIKSFPIKEAGVLLNVDPNDFLVSVHYTDTRLVSTSQNINGDYVAEYIIFQGFTNELSSGERNTMIQSFKDVIDKYINVWLNRTDIDPGDTDGQKLLDIFNDDTHLSILFNMLFEGTSDQEISKLMRVDVYKLKQILDFDRPDYSVPFPKFGPEGGSPSSLEAHVLELIVTEDRCRRSMTTGAIKSLKVNNPGSGYAFEIEERVPPSGIVQNINDGTISVQTKVKDARRRLETYCLDSVEIIHNGTGYNVDDIISIQFNDTDFRRNQIYIKTEPTVKITEVNESGTITDWEIANSGEFYKYVGTGQHRAFPVAIVVNNYWNHLDNSSSEIGQHAKLRAVVGVDPSDTKTYGKIKRVAVEFGGINYMEPSTYWTIDTKMGTYNDKGELTTGLDIQHLVNNCKYNINGSGLNSDQIDLYRAFMLNPYYIPFFSETLSLPEKMGSPDDKFKYNIKHYLHTGADNNRDIITWADKAQHWSTVAFSGSCPFASGGLLDRTYSMALIEENLMYSMDRSALDQSPIIPIVGNCSSSVCSEIIDPNHPACNTFNAYNPLYPKFFQCGGYCDTYTAYDAHRYAYDHSQGIISSAFVNAPPYVLGCSNTLPLDTDNKKNAVCWLGTAVGGIPRTEGYVNWPMMNNPTDKCYNAEYSMYLEIAKYLEPFEDDPGADPKVFGVARAKTITYKMKDPITMKISFNDSDHSDYLGTLVCPSGEFNTMTDEDKVKYVSCSGCNEE